MPQAYEDGESDKENLGAEGGCHVNLSVLLENQYGVVDSSQAMKYSINYVLIQ